MNTGRKTPRSGIRRRITGLILPLFLLSLGVCAAAFLSVGLYQVHIAEEGSRGTADLAVRYSGDLLLEQGVHTAVQFADAKAEHIQAHMDGWTATLYSLRDTAAALYARREQLPGGTLPTYLEAAEQGDAVTVHYGVSPDMAADAVWRRELAFYANAAPYWVAAVERGEHISGVFLTSPSGLNIGCDRNAAGKTGYAPVDLRESDWYTGALESGGLYASDAYRDSFGRGLTVTLSTPVYADGSLLGVLGMDILIEHINQDILQTDVAGHGLAALVSGEGKIISPPELSGKALEELIVGEGVPLSGREAQAVSFAGEPVYAVLRELGGGWTLLLVLPVDEVTAPAHQAAEGIGELARATRERMTAQLARSLVLTMLMFAALALAAVRSARRVANRLADPIVRLCRDVEGIGGGNLHYTCTIRTGDEIEQLGLAFQGMTHKLERYIRQLAEITADRERIAAELNVATRIQTGMLPCIFPPFPHRSELDLYAAMRPAREVGGDFYDFFLVGEDRLAMVIGDVSGKGVPAALFMVIAKTLIKNECQMGLDPARVLEEVNRQLSRNNDGGLFVTAFLCVLDIPGGQLTWANAGHNPPLIRREGRWEWLPAEPGFVLAGLEDMAYRQESARLTAGDALLLYTDGVTDSRDARGALFSSGRLLEALRAMPRNQGARGLVEEVVDMALAFGGGAQTDDMTLLALIVKKEKNKGESDYAEDGSVQAV